MPSKQDIVSVTTVCEQNEDYKIKAVPVNAILVIKSQVSARCLFYRFPTITWGKKHPEEMGVLFYEIGKVDPRLNEAGILQMLRAYGLQACFLDYYVDRGFIGCPKEALQMFAQEVF